ncbi:hypothetical protein [Streptomyces sp. NBC_01353]
MATSFWGFSRELLEEFDVETEPAEVPVASGGPVAPQVPEPVKV